MYDFDKVLLKPNIDPLDINTQRIRRNLIVTSIITFFFTLGASGLDSKSSFVGIKFTDLKIEYVQILILGALLYFLLHFIWAVVDHLKENRLRLTGVAIPMLNEVGMQTATTNLDANTDDSRQSTIYSWWLTHKYHSEIYLNLIGKIKNQINENNDTAIHDIRNSINDIQNKAEYIEEVLLRYEKGFWYHQRSQLLRWIVLDFGMPVTIGSTSIVLMIIKLLT